MDNIIETLHDALSQMNITLPNHALVQSVNYLHLLDKWNSVYNLTALHGVETMLVNHLLDSFSVLAFVEGERIADVGTGAGLPGIPLAIACPDKQFVLVDANRKKTRFLQQAITVLGLTNVEVKHARIESLTLSKPVSCIVTRAFGTLDKILQTSKQLLDDGGLVVAMKGPNVGQEPELTVSGFKITDIHELAVPHLQATRKVVIIRK